MSRRPALLENYGRKIFGDIPAALLYSFPMPPSNSLLELREVTKVYAAVADAAPAFVLRDVTETIAAGDSVAVVEIGRAHV